ncbi:hypothetical protein CG91_gp017 [Mycobacterium phage 39HC]|uniref:hypothetical protein n=1 Tax=Mycobacterium phage 39HC TaxID=1463809 RepID=UPI0003F1CD7E|nr:hypothetical protein CG91_gp017 [Mycobacterium phage 39HC]AHJ88317.1 hypothetical protein 39HC_017 [Mycobacterium phage 39HC]
MSARDRPARQRGPTMITTAVEIDREFRVAIAHTEASTAEVRMARALFDVHALDARPDTVADALSAAARLVDMGLLPSQVRRLFGNGGQMHDLVTEAVAAVR